jgi:hypothetical protein
VKLLVMLIALVLVASPLEAQRSPRRDPRKITREELVDYRDAPMSEVISRARPNFLMFNAGGGAGLAEQTVSATPYGILVYVGTQQQGDTSVLRFFKATEVKEVLYFKPGNSLSPHTGANAFVIQLVMPDRLKP